MTAPTASLQCADVREAAGLAAFLTRLLHYDRAAAVRLQSGGGALAVFGRPPSFEVIAVRTALLRDGDAAPPLDLTVSAGELLDGIDDTDGRLALPAPVTGPPWSGVLPPRGGWQEVPGLPGADALGRAVAAAVAEFAGATSSSRRSGGPAPNGTGSAVRSGPAPSPAPGFRCAPRTPPSRWASSRRPASCRARRR